MGSAVSGPCDLNGDGVPEQVAGAYGGSAPARVHADTKTVYFQFNRADIMADGENYDAHAARLWELVESRPIDRFVLDLRFNTGGNNEIAAPSMEKLARLEKEGKLGTLYVRQLRSVDSVPDRLSDEGRRAELLQPRRVGDPCRKGRSTDDLSPDLPVVLTSEDYFRGQDPSLATILGQVEGR